MNLVAKEFVAARDDELGVLVLSSFTGASRELAESLIVNPYDLDEASDALAAALAMPEAEQRVRMRAMRSFVAEFNVYRWAGRMLRDAERLRRRERLAGRFEGRAGDLPGTRSLRRWTSECATCSVPDTKSGSRHSSRRRPLLAFDFDGTLAPLIEQPALADAGPETRRLLSILAISHPVVIISGRMRADVERRFANLPLAGITGNHGLEPWGEDPDARAAGRRVARRSCNGSWRGCPAIIIEDKRLSITVDYRHAPDLEMTATAIQAVTHQLPRARLLGGRHADFNIAPAGTAHKGTALQHYLERFERQSALYVGDDRTDEDVFGLDLPGLLSVRVGPRRTSHAAFFIRDQTEVDQLAADARRSAVAALTFSRAHFSAAGLTARPNVGPDRCPSRAFFVR